MKKINTIFEQVYNWFSVIRGIHLVAMDEDIPAYFFNSEHVHIMITGSPSAERPFGTLKMEAKETFYDWKHAYYECSLPKTFEEFERVLQDMKNLIKKEHIEKSDNFYRYFDAAKEKDLIL